MHVYNIHSQTSYTWSKWIGKSLVSIGSLNKATESQYDYIVGWGGLRNLPSFACFKVHGVTEQWPKQFEPVCSRIVLICPGRVNCFLRKKVVILLQPKVNKLKKVEKCQVCNLKIHPDKSQRLSNNIKSVFHEWCHPPPWGQQYYCVHLQLQS